MTINGRYWPLLRGVLEAEAAFIVHFFPCQFSSLESNVFFYHYIPPTLPPALGRALNQDNKKTPHKTRKDPVLAVKGRVSKEIYQPRFTPQTLVGGFCSRISRRETTTQGLPSVTDAIAWHFAPG